MEKGPPRQPRTLVGGARLRDLLQLVDLVLQLGGVLLGGPELGPGRIQLRRQALDGRSGAGNGGGGGWWVTGRGRGGGLRGIVRHPKKGAHHRPDPTWDAGPLCVMGWDSSVSIRGSFRGVPSQAFSVLSLSHP